MALSKQITARELALEILEAVLEQGAYANLALNKALNQSHLSNTDKALVTELVYGTLTRKITLEWYLSSFIPDRDQLDSPVYPVLLLTLYQMLYLKKIPNRAAIHQAVDLVKKRLHSAAGGYVNAVLRKIQDQGVPDPASIKRLNKRLSVTYSLPVWLVRDLITEYGQERAEAIMASLLWRNRASIRIQNMAEKASLRDQLDARDSEISPCGLVKDHGPFAASQAFKEGLVTIQDESSQLVAPTLNLEGWERVLDACSAPGGKTTHIASYLDKGQVVALDLYDHKLALIEETAQRLGLTDRIKTQRLDARAVHKVFPPRYFDKILVDAPCSGIGLLRRKPDIRYRKNQEDLDQLQAVQLEILDSVCQTLQEGGIITYSTCTIFAKENQEVIQKFLEGHPDFEQVPLIHPKTEMMVDGCLLITPELFGTDGFFISQLRKKS
ncbi:16S rRNA (cytosine(967)-C(5))-methyltransferase RsmB [Streptococcus sp. 121]|uniref:16S rRNA (cytosine(967)-C(5))-methyltransferase RsmB n=1 Tax=Streptococcus sp. 121 TaxID=2797637 RepID=UPI0018F0E6FF|nr:16S rRNA (cytosine(967)-C(5))-methyltransferase RsmB [Streptococcus sp. 121]MBJ6745959.1 16S rRNA (cytosine(967)-C(5))-methyltransferase RsmB [Streptococcus sp. 121]